uniref:Uncharacterized protein n=1 Tax=Pyrodinium bahamense TaxID=73915 RepID=A0A7S0FJG1_9DINO|mmetsp:Transcript_34376/g.95032  ORF Transcript_34376/g.95032 Transcript_34376/m.95032 type:complete len:217 (+) Transcript_34376:34-684(+)
MSQRPSGRHQHMQQVPSHSPSTWSKMAESAASGASVGNELGFALGSLPGICAGAASGVLVGVVAGVLLPHGSGSLGAWWPKEEPKQRSLEEEVDAAQDNQNPGPTAAAAEPAMAVAPPQPSTTGGLTLGGAVSSAVAARAASESGALAGADVGGVFLGMFCAIPGALVGGLLGGAVGLGMDLRELLMSKGTAHRFQEVCRKPWPTPSAAPKPSPGL